MSSLLHLSNPAELKKKETFKNIKPYLQPNVVNQAPPMIEFSLNLRDQTLKTFNLVDL